MRPLLGLIYEIFFTWTIISIAFIVAIMDIVYYGSYARLLIYAAIIFFMFGWSLFVRK